MAPQTYAEQLERARRVFSVATADAELQARLAQVGYNAAALQQGQALYDAALDVRPATHAAHGSIGRYRQRGCAVSQG